MQESDLVIQTRIRKVLPILNEQQRRYYLASEADSLGRGGITRISRLSGVSRSLISRGQSEQAGETPSAPAGRIRDAGGGRKKVEDKQEGLRETIEEIVSPHTMGDPCNPLLWSSKSLRHIQSALAEHGYHVSHEVVRKQLKSMGYSLQLNRKTKEGGTHPDRDAQFEYINEKVKFFASDHHCKPFSARNEQMEQNRTQALLFYHQELARKAIGVSGSNRQSYSFHHNR